MASTGTENENSRIENLYTLDTEYCSDSLEWCPHEPNQNVFVCANYQLKEDTRSEGISASRFGRILICSISPIDGLTVHQKISTAAVLDQKWCHNKINSHSVLGVANAEKKVEIYKLNPKNINLELICDFLIDSDATETLTLSLDWSTGISKSESPSIICSDSKGNVHLLKFENDKLSLDLTCHGHDFEAWICGFYYWDTNIFFSGGDDSILLKYDQRMGLLPISKNRQHNAGVTSFHSNNSKEYLIATGSYDEHVRLWDMRNMKTERSSFKMPGTLWRLKWDPIDQNYLLAACMLGGIHIVDVNNPEMHIAGSFYNHKKIAYGSDWCHTTDKEYLGNADYIIGTCSFYDHLLCISKVKLSDNT